MDAGTLLLGFGLLVLVVLICARFAHMRFVGWLWRTEVAALGALVVCATAVAVYGFAAAARVNPASALSPAAAGVLFFAYAGYIGAFLTILYGAPVYAFLAHKRLSSWPAVIALGAIPGLLFLLVDTWLGAWSLGCGLIVASITHALMQRWAGRSSGTLETQWPGNI